MNKSREVDAQHVEPHVNPVFTGEPGVMPDWALPYKW